MLHHRVIRHFAARTQLRELAYAQAPLALAVIVVTAYLALTDPGTLMTPMFLVGISIQVILVVALPLIPWDRGDRAWMLSVIAVDVISIAMISQAAGDDLPGAHYLLIFPLFWVAYTFSWKALPFSPIAALFVGLFPYVITGEMPTNGDVGGVVMLVLCVSLMSVAARVVARQLKAQRTRLELVSAQLTKSLRDSEERQVVVSFVSDAVDAGIHFIDPDGRTVSMNRMATEMAGQAGFDPRRTDAGARGLLQEDRVTPVPVEEQIATAALRGEYLREQLYWVGDSDRARAIMATAHRVESPAGDHLGSVIMSNDVTALAQAISARDDFLTTVSHELRTPLTSIIGYLEVLDDDLDVDGLGIRVEMDVLQRNASRLLALIGELLDAADSLHPLELRETPVNDIVASSVRRSQSRADVAGLTLDWQPSGDSRVTVDPARIEQLLDQLLSNAIKFSASGSTVTVAADAAAQGSVTVSVTDRGIGVDPRDQVEVFEKFFRTKEARDMAIPGIGLGLYKARKIAVAHSGSVSLSSELGQGTTVALTLPAVAAL